MEFGIAEIIVDGARWKGELWAPIKTEKGKIELSWIPSLKRVSVVFALYDGS